MKTETGEYERLHEAFVSLSETAQPTADCPDPERLWSASRGEAPPDETREMIEHTATCPACAEAWRLAVHLSEKATQEQAAPPREVAHRRTAAAPWWRYAAVAAVVVFAVLGVSQMTDLTGPAPPNGLRSAEETGLVSDLPADVPLSRDNFVLRWRLEPPREGVLYTIRVMTEDLDQIASAQDRSELVFQVPAADLAQLPAGTKVLWYVEATLADGGRLDQKTFEAVLE